MKFRILFLTSIVSTPSIALESLIAHIDIDPRYNQATNTWTWGLIADGVQKDPALCFFPGRDLPTGSSGNRTGERHTQPASASWNFLGAGAGQPVWIYTETDNRYSWIGFASAPALFTQPLEMALHSVDGPAGGFFSLYSSTLPNPTVRFRTIDGIDAQDVYRPSLSHGHINWAFSRKGMWRVNMTVRGFIGSGTGNPTSISPVLPLHFAIGDRAQWRATHFQASNVMNENVAGELADADGDGLNNLMEYAMGGNPLVAGAVSTERTGPLMPQQGIFQQGQERFLQMEYFRRVTSSTLDVSYTVEWSNSLDATDWQGGGQMISVSPVNTKWEKITIRDTVSITSTTRRFCRVKITAL